MISNQWYSWLNDAPDDSEIVINDNGAISFRHKNEDIRLKSMTLDDATENILKKSQELKEATYEYAKAVGDIPPTGLSCRVMIDIYHPNGVLYRRFDVDRIGQR